MKNLVLILIATLALTACTKKSEDGGAASGTSEATAGAGSKATPEKDITISSVGETMAYDKTDLTVKAGEEITLKFINNSTTLEHNWLLIKPGTGDEVGVEGIKAGRDKEFIPEGPNVLAHTHLVAPKGQDSVLKKKSTGEDTIKFKAPAAGDYPYICTNAGHHTVMKGTLHSIP